MMIRTALATSLLGLLLSPAASANNFSVSGPGGAIPDCPNSPGAWNLAPTWGTLTSTVNVLNPVKSITKVTLTGLTHTWRGDVHAYLVDPAGVRHNVLVRAGFDGATAGDGGNYNLGNYAFVESGGGSVAQGTTDIGGGTYNQYLNSGGGMWTSGSFVINNTPLSSISGPAGTWTLVVVDWFNQDTGSITGWTLEGTDTLDPGLMYFTPSTTNTIHRANLDGSGEVDLGTSFTSENTRVSIDVAGGKIYWASPATNTIHRANLDGSSEQDLMAGSVFGTELVSLDLQGGKLYWSDGGTNTIHRANLDGSSEEDLLAGSVLLTPISLDVPGGKMYWADGATTTIHRANLDGSSEQDLMAGFVFGTELVSLDLQGGKMYWADSTNTIHRANLDGSAEVGLGGVAFLCLGIPFFEYTNITLDVPGGKMYWADAGTNTIHRANLDGSSNQDLLAGFVVGTELVSLDLQGGKMYWVDAGTNTVHRANLDGSSEQDLATDVAFGSCGLPVDLLLPLPPLPTMVGECFPGTGGVIACPCGQPANPTGGCANHGAGSTSGGVLSGGGVASVGADTLSLTVSNLRSPAIGVLNVFFSYKPGPATPTTGIPSGAGVRCYPAGGDLRRLYTAQVFGGSMTKPGMGDLSVSAKSATFLPHVIVPPETRHYFNVYRDGQAAGPCGNPLATTNLTNMGAVLWSP